MRTLNYEDHWLDANYMVEKGNTTLGLMYHHDLAILSLNFTTLPSRSQES